MTTVTPVDGPVEDTKADQTGQADEAAPKKAAPTAALYDRSMVNDIHQTFINGTFPNAVVGALSGTSGRTTRLTGLVGESEIATLRRFVRPKEFDDGVDMLVRERMLVLCGSEGSGRRASALSLLREVTAQKLYMLSPQVSVAELAEHEYEPGCGYVAIDRVVERAGEESDFEWRLVRDRVVEHASYLVVTRLPKEGANQLGHMEWSSPAVGKVLRAYWREPEDWSEEDAGKLADALNSVDRVSDVVGLGKQLAGGKSLDDALSHLDTRIREVVGKWFDENMENPSRMIEITALSFTVGVDERTYEAGLQRLKRMLDKYFPEPVDEEDAPKTAPRYNLRELLRENELIAIGTVPTELGTQGATVFARPEYHRHVLAQLWKRMDVSFWDAVSSWLDEIVVRPAYEMCVAGGLAELSVVAIGEVVPIAFHWARGSRGPAGRRAAVYLLYLMASDDSLAPAALKLATEWILRGEPNHRWVAAMAFIGQLGVRYPHDARRRLWQICVQWHTVDGDIEHVFGEFFSTLVRSSENANLVLTFLGEKVERFLRVGARPEIRLITAQVVIAVVEAKDVKTRHSSVLTHLAEFPGDTAEVGRLLAGVLMVRPVRRRALKALHGLLEDLARDEKTASTRAKTLGEVLRAHLPPDEHGPLEDHFRIVAEQQKGTDIKALINAVLDALQARVAGDKQ
ncbi:hypothetical protein [Amycolatopsis sp. NPDC052450]|uniref:hypothetical protein n=1 Tax=Amycolatopsis sp. NPDC052450 TaxID=3363937 RepID=UPI0037CB6013